MRALDNAQKVLDRLAGRDISACARTRNSANYAMWDRIADFLETNPTKAQILQMFHSELNMKSAYRYNHVAFASRKAVDLVIQEREWK